MGPASIYTGSLVIAIKLRYLFALSCNTLSLRRNVIVSIINRSEHMGAVIASYSYRSKFIDQHYLVIGLRIWICFSTFPISLFTELKEDFMFFSVV